MGIVGKKSVNRVEMVGNTYNSWKVLEHVETENKIAYYKCECLECNTEHIVDGRNIRSERSKRCTPCGLKLKTLKQTGKKKTKKSPKDIAEHYLYKSKIKCAKQRGRFWELSQSDFLSLIYKNCNYCGAEPMTTVNPTTGLSMVASRAKECFITYNGIDRIDNSKGYVAGNVVTCCKMCNTLKGSRTVEEFERWINRLAETMKTLK